MWDNNPAVLYVRDVPDLTFETGQSVLSAQQQATENAHKAELRRAFKRLGHDVVDVKLPLTSLGGKTQSRGHAFILFETVEAADKALAASGGSNHLKAKGLELEWRDPGAKESRRCNVKLATSVKNIPGGGFAAKGRH